MYYSTLFGFVGAQGYTNKGLRLLAFWTINQNCSTILKVRFFGSKKSEFLGSYDKTFMLANYKFLIFFLFPHFSNSNLNKRGIAIWCKLRKSWLFDGNLFLSLVDSGWNMKQVVSAALTRDTQILTWDPSRPVSLSSVLCVLRRLFHVSACCTGAQFSFR